MAKAQLKSIELTVVVKNGCAKASLTVIRFSGSTTKHFLMRSLGSSVFFYFLDWMRHKTKSRLQLWNSHRDNSMWGKVRRTRNIGPFRRCKTVFTLHYISQHNHLLPVPERRATHQQCKHDDTTRPAKWIKEETNVCDYLLWYYWWMKRPRKRDWWMTTYISTSFEYPGAFSHILHFRVSGAK